MNTPKITIRISFDSASLRLVLLAFFIFCLSGSTALAKGEKSATSVLISSPGHSYYLTKSTFKGSSVLTACEVGYHFAALWEILDTSNLSYNAILGEKKDDGVPPTLLKGWVRTGSEASNVGAAGIANCNAWTSGLDSDNGTVIWLPSGWLAPGSTMGVWAANVLTCDTYERVWCVKD